MNDLERLRARKAEADSALADAERELLAELADAKKAYRKAKTPENKVRLEEAKNQVRLCRQIVREGRGALVGGDAYVDEGGE